MTRLTVVSFTSRLIVRSDLRSNTWFTVYQPPICSTTWARQTAKRKLCLHLQLYLLSQFHRFILTSEWNARTFVFRQRSHIGAVVTSSLFTTYKLRYHDVRARYLQPASNVKTFETPSPVSIDVRSQYAPTTKRFWEELSRAVSFATNQHKTAEKRPNQLSSPSLSPPLVPRDCGLRQALLFVLHLQSKRLLSRETGSSSDQLTAWRRDKRLIVGDYFWGIRINQGARTCGSTSISVNSNR